MQSIKNSLPKFGKILGLVLGVTMLFGAPVFAQATQNIVEIAQGNDNLSTLVTAVTEAELVDTLSDSEANFTVFAPTNEAFENLPDGTLDSLLQPENQDELTDVLTYHVVDSEAFAGDLSDGQTLTTVQGETLTVSIEGENVFINGNQVVTADVDATNGVVHVIDGVLLPEGIADSAALADTGAESTQSNAIYLAALATAGIAGLALTGFSLKKLELTR